MLEGLREMEWTILNGNTRGDEKEEYTYTGAKGETVIDYVIGDNEVRDQVEWLEVSEKIDSDHHPLVIKIKERNWERKGRNKQKKKVRRGIWTGEGRESFRREIRWTVGPEEKEIGVGKEIKAMTKEFKRVLEERGEGDMERKRGGWWDEECRDKKKEVRKAMREWREKGEGKEAYKEEKREYKEMCMKKSKEENERFEKEVEEAKTESKVWEVINKERTKRRKVDDSIEMKE